MLTLKERINIVILMAKLESVTMVERQLKKEGAANIPTHKHMRSIYAKFKETGSVEDSPRSGRPSVEEAKVEKIREVFEDNNTTSIRKAAAITDIPKSTVHKALRQNLQMKPYKIFYAQQLFDDDKMARISMCNVLHQLIDSDERFLSGLCFSDEATFNLRGSVNRHNCVIWGTEKPYSLTEFPIKSPGITVWCAMCKDQIIGPYFFEGTVTAKSYKTMLECFFIPELKRRRKFNSTTFQQDGAPPHWGLEVRAFLNENFPGRWIGRDGPILWAARSPDLTPLDFYLWGFLKDRVYGRRPNNLFQLRQFIEEEISAISPETLAATFLNFQKRLQLCLHEDGGHFEHRL